MGSEHSLPIRPFIWYQIMPVVWIPSLMRNLTDGLEQIEVDATDIGQLVAQLDARFPGFRKRLCAENEDRIRPNIAVMIDGRSARKGMGEPVDESSEVHFLPAIGGG